MADMHYGPRRPGYYGAYDNKGEVQSRTVMTETAVRELAEKYDVSRLSRNAYSLLLCELRSAGYITTQEFSAGYGGTLPRGVVLEPFPLGDNEADFIELLGEYVQYCGEFLSMCAGNDAVRAHTLSLLDTYSRLRGLFKQIHDAALKQIPDPQYQKR